MASPTILTFTTFALTICWQVWFLLKSNDEDESVCMEVTSNINLVEVPRIAVKHRDQSGAFTVMAALAAYRHLLRSTRIAFHGTV